MENRQPGPGQPSDSALTAAAARAAHLIVDDEPRIFTDPLAARLLGSRADELIGYHTAHGTHPVLSGARVQVPAGAGTRRTPSPGLLPRASPST